MEELDEELECVEDSTKKTVEASVSEDLDIYGDLETAANGSEVIERFNRRFSPKKRLYDDHFSEEDDFGLYDDLNAVDKQLVAEELEAKVATLEVRCTDLDKENAKLKAELEKVNKVNLVLRRNISSIFKTAKAELERKERQLKDLQREHDSLIFRRGARSNPANYNSQNTATADNQASKNTEKTKENLERLENKNCSVTPSADLKPMMMQNSSESSGHSEVRSQQKIINQAVTKQSDTSRANKVLESKSNLTSSSKQNHEDGEIKDNPSRHTRPSMRRSESMRQQQDHYSNSRRRSRSRSRSPQMTKRKRSPSAERLQGKRPNDRDGSNRFRQQPRSSTNPRFRDSEPGHFHSRSSRR